MTPGTPTNPTKLRETDVARPLIGYLRDHGVQIAQEVTFRDDLAVADLVVRWLPAGPYPERIGVIEAKTSLSAKLLRQAFKWRQYADFVAIALPRPQTRAKQEEREKCYELIAHLGLGLYHIDVPTRGVEKVLNPKVERIEGRSEALAKAMSKHTPVAGAQAGQAAGPRFTRWRETVDNLVGYVRQHPGATLKEALHEIEHHYGSRATAIQKLSGQARAGTLDQWLLIEPGPPMRFYPKEGHDA